MENNNPFYLFDIFRYKQSGAKNIPDEESYVFECYMAGHSSREFEKNYESLSYLAAQVTEVKQDWHIMPSKRRFYDLVVKVKEDIENDPVYYELLAEPVLKWMKEDIDEYSNTIRTEEWCVENGIASDIKKSYGLVLKLLDRLFRANHFEPSRLYSYLNQYVIGQDRAKRILSTAVYGHMKRIKYTDERFVPDSVVLVGPSGCGKTELVKHLIEVMDLPCVFSDVSSMGGSQYSAGKKREDLLRELYWKAGGDMKTAQMGVIFMDEFDKILVPSYSSTGTDIHGEVQGQLLTMIEGARMSVNIPGEGDVDFDTSRVLFILAGAFQGIEEYIKDSKKSQGKFGSNIGFGASLLKEMDTSYSSSNVTQDVLMRFGMKKELAGRIGHIAVVNQLSRDEMIRILTEPKNSILERYSREIRLYCGANLEIEPETIEKIADMAIEYGVGARGLSIVLRKLMTKILYEAPERKNVKTVKMTIESGEAVAEWIGEEA